MSLTSNIQKSKFWAFVAYPDSLPDDWLDLLQETGLLFCVSPLHDRDLNADGTQKKDHYHVILLFNGPTTFNHVKNITSALGQPIPIALLSVRGYYRYLTHIDNPEKAQYDKSLIRHFNGAIVEDFYQLSTFEVNEFKITIQKIILDQDILEYSDLIDFLLFTEANMDLYDIATNHTLFFNSYIRSRRHKRKESIT